MMRSLFAGVSGLRNHQIRMDVIGNNIANVNTVGYKASRVTFRELFSQTMRGASAPTDERGGTNPMQIGLGMTLGTIDEIHEGGNIQFTGVNTDMALEGDGMFILKGGGATMYTRVGSFTIDSAGNLVDKSTGLRVQGWKANKDGSFGTKDSTSVTDLQVPLGGKIPPMPTEKVKFVLNLDARVDINPHTSGGANFDPLVMGVPDKYWEEQVGYKPTYTAESTVHDSLGNRHQILLNFDKVYVEPGDPNDPINFPADPTKGYVWNWRAIWLDPDSPTAVPTVIGDGVLEFDPTGALATSTINNPITLDPTNGAAQNQQVTVDFDDITQYADRSNVGHVIWDGYSAGEMEDFTVDASGVLTGVYSNGVTMDIGQVAVASFANPAGLLNQGQNLYVVSNNSGTPLIGAPGTGHRGKLAPGSLEMSNVDLSQEFTDMIITQRGFQANSRTITTSDEMLLELVNLKR